MQEAQSLERFVERRRELAVMVARGRDGETAVYPVTEMVFDEDANVLSMLLAPALALGLLLARRHLVEGLMSGVVAAIAIGLALGLVAPGDLLYIDHDNFIAAGLILDGMERGVGVSILTILLMGLVGGLEASGITDRIIAAARRHIHSPRGAETWIFATISAVVPTPEAPGVAANSSRRPISTVKTPDVRRDVRTEESMA